MQQKSGLKYMILEKKITAMREELDIKEAQLYAATSTESTRVPSIHEVRDVVKEQNERIRALERQIRYDIDFSPLFAILINCNIFSQMRLRREWGDGTPIHSSSSSSVSSSTSSRSSRSSTRSSGSRQSSEPNADSHSQEYLSD